MKTLERIHLAADFFSGERLGFRDKSGLVSLLELELGHAEMLDHPVQRGPGVKMQAIAPREIYHLCASNLDVSAEMSLMLGLVLGSRLVFKLPSAGLPGFEMLAFQAADVFGVPVTLLREYDPERMRAADAVVVFGSDATVEKVRTQTWAKQRFLAYGNKISTGLISPGTGGAGLAEKAAREVVAYEQMGCLSPQAYLCPDFQEAEAFAEALALALEKLEKEKPSPAREFEEEGLIFEARQRALLRGNRLWGAAERRPWTVVLRQDGFLEAGPGHRFIQVIPGSDWESILRPWKGKLSSLSLPDPGAGKPLLPQIMNLGFSRVCRIGELQEPCLLWRHDGRPRLADLVTWITIEEHEI
jgi:hypothetical protein